MALLHCNFGSRVLRLAASLDVILPEEACRASGRLPVLYLLHGLSDDHTIWQRRTSIERYAEARGIAVVMPAVDRSFYTDMAAGPDYWTYVSEEVPALAETLFPVSSEPSCRFVAGLSMGGYGALKLALRCGAPRFAAAASLSGAVDVAALARAATGRDAAEYRWRFGDPGEVAGSANDLFHLAAEAAKRPGTAPALFVCCGTEDGLYRDNVRFRDHLRALGLELTWEEGPGAHEWGYWDRQIQRVLAWLPPGAKQ
jgi:putative tributyrin esterase